MSDDGNHGLTIIAFVGSVFSPYYSRAHRKGLADPIDHCALNVALYGKGGKRWSLTERSRDTVFRNADSLVIGPSKLFWDKDTLVIQIDETTSPIPSRIRGTVKLHPSAMSNQTIPLDDHGRHRWSPISPHSRIEVDLTHPQLRWSGASYLDTNSGDEPLEQAFARWHWSRALGQDQTFILYDVSRRSGSDLTLALSCDMHGDLHKLPPPPTTDLPMSKWKISRTTRADAGHPSSISSTLEDTPFYVRSMLSTRLYGQPVTAIHESLCLDRFRAGWVHQLIPFRMRRART